MNLLANIIPCMQTQLSERSLVAEPEAEVYQDESAPLWIVQQGADDSGRSLYFVSDDGNCFHELMETGVKRTDCADITNLEAVGACGFRFEKGPATSSLFQETDAGDVLISGGLARVEPELARELLTRGAFHMIGASLLLKRIQSGDANAILNYNASRNLRGGPSYGRLQVSDEGLAALIQKSKEDERPLLALCVLAAHYCEPAREALSHYDAARLVDAARYYEAPRRILWERAKKGSEVALQALASAAAQSNSAVADLINLHLVWKVAGVPQSLRAVPIAARDLNPSVLQVFADVGHADAHRLLQDYDPAQYVDAARQNTWAYDVGNCPPVSELGALVRHDNQRAIDGLFGLYAEGHLVAREMIRKLIDEGTLGRSIVTCVDMEPLRSRAPQEPRVVIALSRFHDDGHPQALEMLAGLAPVDGLIDLASTNYDAVVALSLLDRSGNPGIRERIKAVSIEKWQKDYSLRGHSALDGREAREAMSILASLGNAAAREHEGFALPQRRAAALGALLVAAELAREMPVEVVVGRLPLRATGDDVVAKDEKPIEPHKHTLH